MQRTTDTHRAFRGIAESGIAAWKRAACALLSLFLSFAAWAQSPVPANKPAAYPAWWFERDVIRRTDAQNSSPSWPADYPVSDDYSVINQGQLKNLAAKACAELQAKLPAAVWSAPAGTALLGMVSGWGTSTAADNYAIVNQGQLKTVAQKFYDVLALANYVAGMNLPPPGWSTGAYPWSETAADDDAYAAVNTGQAKYLFSFDLPLQTNPFPAWWLNQYFPGQTGIDPEADPDGDDLTNLQEYQAGSDPLDFFNTLPPVLTIVDGNNQGDLPGNTLARPFAVRIGNQRGTPLRNATVAFSIQSGGGRLSLVDGGKTDANGVARAYLQLPSTVGTKVLVEATFGTLGATFAATVGNASLAPNAPGKPEVTQEHGATVAQIVWEDRSDNETAFYIERALNGNNWTRIATLPANTTSYTDTTVIADKIYFYRIVAHNEAAQ